MIVTRTRTTKIKVYGVGKNPYSRYTKQWRAIRAKMSAKLSTCWLCRKKFKDGQDIYLLSTSKGNKVACANCATSAYEELGDDNQWKVKDA